MEAFDVWLDLSDLAPTQCIWNIYNGIVVRERAELADKSSATFQEAQRLKEHPYHPPHHHVKFSNGYFILYDFIKNILFQ